jgi:DNA-binding LacI/PurR family transcriptional regulator
LSVTPDVALQKILTIQQQLGKRGFSVPLHSMAFGDEERHVQLMSSLRRQRPRAIIYCLSYADEGITHELRRYIEEGGIAIVTVTTPTQLIFHAIRCSSIPIEHLFGCTPSIGAGTS